MKAPRFKATSTHWTDGRGRNKIPIYTSVATSIPMLPLYVCRTVAKHSVDATKFDLLFARIFCSFGPIRCL